MKKLFVFLGLFFILLPSCAFADDDIIQCVESEKRILCSLFIPGFIQTSAPLLVNGWENTFQISIELRDAEKLKLIKRTKLEASQRCYLDPIESPCLILWRGAKNWQRYKDEDVFLHAMSKFGFQAFTLVDLPPGNYIVRVTFQIMPSAQKRVESIRNWFKQDGDPKTFSFGNSSLIGSIIGSRAESAEDSSQIITLSTTPFYIDLNTVAPPIYIEEPYSAE